MNRYFIIDFELTLLLNLINKIVGNFQEQRINNTQTKMVVKLIQGDNTDYPELQSYPEFDYDGILVELKKPEWN